MENRVSCFFRFQENSFGPMPMENSFTGMPVSRAAKKCPASCTVTITPNITMAANTYKNVIESPLFSSHAATNNI